MFLTFAGITFQGIKLPQSFDGNFETNYGQIPIIGSKPVVQGTGEKLDEYDITALFHVEFCIPRDEMDALQKVRKAGVVDYLVDGTGRNYGKFVITTLSEGKVTCLDNGYPTAITCQFHLLEYNTNASVLKQTGSALVSQNPVSEIALLPKTSVGMSIANSVKAGQISSNKLQSLLPVNLTPTPTISTGMFTKIASSIDSIKTSFSNANAKVQAIKKTIGRINTLKTNFNNNVSAVNSALDDIKAAANLRNPNNLYNLNQNLGAKLYLLNQNYSQIAAFTGSREGGM